MAIQETDKCRFWKWVLMFIPKLETEERCFR